MIVYFEKENSFYSPLETHGKSRVHVRFTDVERYDILRDALKDKFSTADRYPRLHCPRTLFGSTDRNRIEAVLKDNFSSVIFYMNGFSESGAGEVCFNFKDKADEAFFLVWSSDGIEI